jgi:hypothetical protein
VQRTVATGTGVLVVIAAITLVAIFSSGGDSSTRAIVVGGGRTWTPPAAPGAIESEDELRQYVLSRPFWASKPTVYGDSLKLAFEGQASGGGPTLAAVDERGNVEAYSADELISKGPELAGKPIYVVARISSSVTSPVHPDVPFTIASLKDDAFIGPRNSGRFSGVVTGSVSSSSPGDVVFFRAVVGAVGDATATEPTTYVIGLEDPKSISLEEPPRPILELARQFAH